VRFGRDKGRSTTDTLKVVVFYVSDPDTPFLDLAH